LLASKVFSETYIRRKHPHNFLDLIFKEQKVGAKDPDWERAIIHVAYCRSTEISYKFSTRNSFIFNKLQSLEFGSDLEISWTRVDGINHRVIW